MLCFEARREGTEQNNKKKQTQTQLQKDVYHRNIISFLTTYVIKFHFCSKHNPFQWNTESDIWINIYRIPSKFEITIRLYDAISAGKKHCQPIKPTLKENDISYLVMLISTLH